ncbi:MAG: YqgE/AlgH family protein [Bryobacteraceae bacterium]
MLLLRRFMWIAVASGLLAQQHPPQGRVQDLAAGKLLVARRNLPDPNFGETVILLTRYGKEGAMGLIVNLRSEVPLSRVFPEYGEAERRSDPIYLGGPVDRKAVFALLRSAAKPEEGLHVFGDLYMISTPSLLEDTMAAGPGSSKFRVYLGYSGWASQQLEREVEMGTWHIFKAEAGLVFDPDPDTVWSRLIDRTGLRIARR